MKPIHLELECQLPRHSQDLTNCQENQDASTRPSSFRVLARTRPLQLSEVDEKLYESLSSEGGNHSIIVHDGRVHRDGRTIYTNHSRLGFCFFLAIWTWHLFTVFSENIFDSKAFLNFDQIFGMTPKKATYSSIFFGINWDEFPKKQPEINGIPGSVWMASFRKMRAICKCIRQRSGVKTVVFYG